MWPEPSAQDVDDRKRPATHRAVCFQYGTRRSQLETTDAAESWCALFPATSKPFTKAEVLLRLANDRTTLLDIDQGALVHALELPNGLWAVHPVEGTDILIGVPRTGWKPGYAETTGLLPLIIPRPGRRVSPHATALAPRGWSISQSVDSVENWTDRSSRRLRPSIGAAGIAAVALLARFVIRGYKKRPLRPVKRPPALATTPIDIEWRPADDGGCLAWALIDDDKHHRLEAPVVGLQPSLIDSFPTTTEIDGDLAPGKTIRATLTDGTTLLTIRPLAATPSAITRNQSPPRPSITDR